jgi:hypothetical protein
MGVNHPVEPARRAAGQERRADAMTASPSTSPISSQPRLPLRLRLRDSATTEQVDGAWWPQSRDLQAEAADLVDHFPSLAGHIDRLLFSRPDWDNPVAQGRGVRRIQARRGPVKVGSFPKDDTRLMVLVMSTGRRLHLRVIASDADATEADRQLQEIAWAVPVNHPGEVGWARWDEDAPS